MGTDDFDIPGFSSGNHLCPFSVKLTVNLKGEFLGLAVVAVLLQVADGYFL